jgi:terminase small subunit-like protein
MVRGRLFTEKELAFIATYRGYGDGARAAVAAGYARSNAKQQAHFMLKRPAIRQALEEKQRQIIGQSVKLDAAKLSKMSVQSMAKRRHSVVCPSTSPRHPPRAGEVGHPRLEDKIACGELVYLGHPASELVISAADQVSHRLHVLPVAGETEAAEVPTILDRCQHRIMVAGIVGGASPTNGL